MRVEIKLLPGAKAPKKLSEGAAAYDLYVHMPVTLAPNETRLVGTGVRIALPARYAGFIYERSSSHRRGVSLANKVGVIDSDYRGEIQVAVTNITDDFLLIGSGDRVAQLRIERNVDSELVVVDELPSSLRGVCGFGSTGI